MQRKIIHVLILLISHIVIMGMAHTLILLYSVTFPDPDVIRVGDVYYMVSTTMYIFPGATILKSYDLVNWEYCCNPLERIEASDGYNLETGQNRYSRGQWATALQYHNGKFYLLFTTLDEGGYLLTTTDIEGEWEKEEAK